MQASTIMRASVAYVGIVISANACADIQNDGTAGIVATMDQNLRRPDFDHNGSADILWRNTSTGENAVWLMNGTSFSASAMLRSEPPTTGWQIVGTGDFNRDDNTDILWRNTSTGENAVWLMNGTSFSASATLRSEPPTTGWQIVGTGDFNRDDNTDILWRNTSSGENAVWLMNGTSFSASVTLRSEPPTTGWRIVGTGDFNWDDNTDILWRNTSSGENAVWLMNSTSFSASVTLRSEPPTTGWQIVGVS